MDYKSNIVTIDGLAASGKSSAAKGVAEKLGVAYVSSGLFYRALTYLALMHKLDVENCSILQELPDLLDLYVLQLHPNVDGNRVVLQDKGGAKEDITKGLHQHEIDANVSYVARHQPFRSWVKAQLHDLTGNFVIDGRDMGTVVFPQAKSKFYLDASPETRAKRRLSEREGDLEKVLAELKARDAKDEAQAKPAEDAYHIDTEHLNLEQVIAVILDRIQAT